MSKAQVPRYGKRPEMDIPEFVSVLREHAGRTLDSALAANLCAYLLAAGGASAAAFRCKRAIAEHDMSMANACLEQAVAVASGRLPRMALLTCGTAGSGKSTLAALIAQHWGFHHLQTDLIRKRLLGLEPTARTASDVNAGIYSPVVSDQVYGELATQAHETLHEGLSVVLDGSFLTRARRAAAIEAVRAARARVLILHFALDRDEQIRRLQERLAAPDAISEGGVEVMASHERAWEPLLQGEGDAILEIDTSPAPAEVEFALLPLLWRAMLSL
jgi:predicted kinase